jgi:putative ABC transport system permease protein
MQGSVTGAGVREVGPGAAHSAWLTIASEGYFEALGMRLREGRTFTPHDRAGALPVAVVTESFARHFLRGDPVGATVSLANRRTPAPLQIVGVVNDLRHTGLENPGREEIFIPFAQSPFGSVTFVARSTPAAAEMLPRLKDAIRTLVPAQTFPTAATLERMVDATILPRRFYLVLAGTLAAVAFFLAALGIYSLIAFVTVQRTREFGVRMALGGGRADILRLVIVGGMTAPLAGVALGGAAAAATTRLLETYLFGVRPADPATFAAVGALVVLVTLGAACIPALRAVRTDPTVALRHE